MVEYYNLKNSEETRQENWTKGFMVFGYVAKLYYAYIVSENMMNYDPYLDN